MNELQKDMLALKLLSLFIGVAIVLILYEANFFAFECVQLKGGSALELALCLSAFLGAIAVCGFLMLIIAKAYIHVCVVNSTEMFSGASHISAFSTTFVAAFLLVHLVNIFGGWAFRYWGIGTLSVGQVCIFSLLFSLIIALVNFLRSGICVKIKR